MEALKENTGQRSKKELHVTETCEEWEGKEPGIQLVSAESGQGVGECASLGNCLAAKGA